MCSRDWKGGLRLCRATVAIGRHQAVFDTFVCYGNFCRHLTSNLLQGVVDRGSLKVKLPVEALP